MGKNKVKQVKQMIRDLSPEDRRSLIPYLAEFPDSGLQSYDLSEELEVLKKHGKRLTGPNGDDDHYLVNLVFIRNLVSVEMLDKEVLRAVFFPDNFIEQFPKSKRTTQVWSKGFKERFFTEERKAAILAERAANGVQLSYAELEEEITKQCDSMAEIWIQEKAKRIAEQISRHLPGMVGDMMGAAIQGQTFYDYYQAFQELAPDKKPPAMKDLKKLIQDAAWSEVQPHLPSTRNTRTNPAWRSDETLKQYGRRVNERKLLAACIKDMYENCEGEAGWIEDLKQDSNYQSLSKEVPSEIITWAVKRAASEDLPPREREPLSIACEIARQELELPEQSIDTLRAYHSAGVKLLRKDRSQRSQ